MTGVSQILQQLAANAAATQLARGNRYADLIQGISNVPAQILNDQERQQQIDLQRAGEAQRLAIANRADARAQVDQAYQDTTRAQGLAHDRIVNAGLAAAMGPDGDPSKFDAKAAADTVARYGRPELVYDVIAKHRQMQGAPIWKKADEAGIDPDTHQPIPGLEAQPKMPEIGTDAYGRAIAIQDLMHPAGAPAPGQPILPPPPPVLPPAPSGPGAPATTAAPSPMAPPASAGGPTYTDRLDTAIAPPILPPPPAAVPPPPAAPARPLTMAEATAKVYADQRAAAEAAKDPHSAIYKEWQDYTKQGGALGFDAYMTMDANRKKPVVSLSGLNALYSQTDPKGIAQAIQSGSMPPDISQYGRPIQGAVASELAKNGFDLSRAQTDWKATQRHIASLNGNQQLKLNQSINALPDLFDSVEALASQWKGGRFPILNKANLALAKQGAYGSDVASVARQLDAQIADTTADLGVVYMGGNSPTDHGLSLAATALAGDWDEKVLHDMVKLGKANVQIRRNSINNTGVAGASATNPYAAPPAASPPPLTPPPVTPPPAGGPAAPIVVIDPQGGRHPFATQAQADEFKRIARIP